MAPRGTQTVDVVTGMDNIKRVSIKNIVCDSLTIVLHLNSFEYGIG